MVVRLTGQTNSYHSDFDSMYFFGVQVRDDRESGCGVEEIFHLRFGRCATFYTVVHFVSSITYSPKGGKHDQGWFYVVCGSFWSHFSETGGNKVLGNYEDKHLIGVSCIFNSCHPSPSPDSDQDFGIRLYLSSHT